MGGRSGEITDGKLERGKGRSIGGNSGFSWGDIRGTG